MARLCRQFTELHNLPGLHRAARFLLQQAGLHFASRELGTNDRQVIIQVMGDDSCGFLNIGIELREHFIERCALGPGSLGRDAMYPGSVHGDGKVRRVDDETVLALPGAFFVV